MKVSSNVVGDTNDENNFPHKLLTNTQVSKLRKTKEQKAGFLGMLLDTLGTSLLGNLLTGK